MKILVLGGIAESRELALTLHGTGHDVVYSIAGLVRTPELPCEIHSGGFSDKNRNGVQGMKDFCVNKGIQLLLDATHPYAVEISANAVHAAAAAKISCWRFQRPGWNADDYPGWQDFPSIGELLPRITPFSLPFFSIGTSALKFASLRPAHQQWIVRSARPFTDQPGIIQVNAIGPFTLEDELALMQKYNVDALVSKNSGCSRVSAKLDAAQQLGIPVFVQDRPELAPAEQEFDSIASLLDAIVSLRAVYPLH